MNADDARKAIQGILLVAEDGQIGLRTIRALTLLTSLPDDSAWPPGTITAPDDAGWNQVKASSFADPADVSAFRRCKADGGTDMHCFSVGDNGIGFTGLDCSAGSGPACALPPEDWMAKWGSSANAAGKPVRVRINDIEVVMPMKDTMPHKVNIHNGAGIDLSPDAVEALGQHPPLMIAAEWQWV